ncbi:MAG TPA: hypothetical protein VN673_06045 [Clostridia bacterium]|nr:hypothetical protein [Clostridia bacterium]
MRRRNTNGYGLFGEVIRATGPMANAYPFRFSTKYQGPIEEKGGRNLYGLVTNDPGLRLIPPSPAILGCPKNVFTGTMFSSSLRTALERQDCFHLETRNT